MFLNLRLRKVCLEHVEHLSTLVIFGFLKWNGLQDRFKALLDLGVTDQLRFAEATIAKVRWVYRRLSCRKTNPWDR